MPKISVIVPVYKVEKYLCQCIDSILNQTLKDIEVILVDEGDLDACRAIIDMYENGVKKDSRVKAVHEKNGGYGASVNKGMDIATGEYISIIESDDFIEPAMLEEMYNYAKKLDADVVKTPYYEYYEKKKYSPEIIRECFWYNWTVNIEENKTFSIKDYPVLMGIHPSIWSCIYKKEYFDKYNIRFLSDKGPYVDHHFKLVSLLNTEKIAWLNKPFYYYRLTNENASASLFNLPIMIRRWNEFHKFIELNFPNRYQEFEIYNIREEFVNTFGGLLHCNYVYSKSDCELIKENLSYITVEGIINAKNLQNKDRRKLLKLKKNPKLLEKYIKEGIHEYPAQYITIYKILFLGFPLLKIKRKRDDKYKILLFWFLPICNVYKKR